MTIKVEVTTDLIMSLYEQLNTLFPWQKRWYEQRFQRARDLHKGREIGADYYFALEALLDACLTGRNKIFIESAPSDAKDIFISSAVQYLVYFLGRKIKSETRIITLSNGSEIRFYPHNTQTWAGVTGDVYLSEWAYFSEPLNAIDAAMAITAHIKWRLTVYSSIDECAPGKDVKFTGNSWYHDSVPFLPHECSSHHCRKIDGLRPYYSDSYFRQAYLCQLPEGSKPL
ncbi:terminase family protein [Morganella morganii]|uniref:terminase large subunit domain-containing protein n=1 Tax=Morganella morganii TaxID=582 RepID=UPI0025432E23|nr:terminase family protein [Morganella morganii]